MQYLAAYDISDPKRLRKVARTLKSYGIRAQKSVFECSLPESKAEEMMEKVDSIISDDADSFRMYPLYNDAIYRQCALGMARINQFPGHYVI